MEKDELVKKLQIAKDFVSQIENLFGIAQQCENGYILAQNKKRKTTIATVVIVALFIYAIIGLSMGAMVFGEFLMALVALGIAFLITKKLKKKYLKEMQGFAEQYAQYDEHIQHRINEDIDLVSFLPEIYQNSEAIAFIEEAIRTGVASSLDVAIQQYHAYAGRVESQMAIAQQAAMIQAELDDIRRAIEYRHY